MNTFIQKCRKIISRIYPRQSKLIQNSEYINANHYTQRKNDIIILIDAKKHLIQFDIYFFIRKKTTLANQKQEKLYFNERYLHTQASCLIIKYQKFPTKVFQCCFESPSQWYVIRKRTVKGDKPGDNIFHMFLNTFYDI